MRRSDAGVDIAGSSWAAFNFTYAPATKFTSEASLYGSKNNFGGFFGLQIYTFEAKDVARSQRNDSVYVPGETYLANPFGANLITGLHYQFFPGARILGGIVLSAARASRLSDKEALSGGASTGNILSRGLIPYVEYEHPWSESVKTKADVAVNPSDLSSLAQWGLKLLLLFSGFEVHGEVDDVKTLGGHQIMAGIRGIKPYASSEDGSAPNKAIVRAGHISRTSDSTLTLPEIQSLKTGNYAIAELWHNWLIAGVSFVENVGPGARIGVGRELQKFQAVASAQYKYLMSDIYGARVDTFSVYFSVLAKDLF